MTASLSPSVLAEPVSLWRCSACGKWSHAKRQPRSHVRFAPYDDSRDDEVLPAGAVVVEERGGQEWDTGAHEFYGWMIRCGPFDAWTALPSAQPEGATP